MSKNGLLIALCGIDGCGKTTFSQIVAQDLMIKFGGENVIHVQQPGATPIGAELRRLVKSKEFPIQPITERLIFAADAAEFFDYARTEIAAGKIIVSDRFAPVTDLVYGVASDVPLEMIYNLHGWIKPVTADLFIVLKCSWEIAKQRKVKPITKVNLGSVSDSCRIEAKGDEFLTKVSNIYKTISETNAYVLGKPEHLSVNEIAHKRAKRIRVVDAEESWDAVRGAVRGHVDKLLLDNGML